MPFRHSDHMPARPLMEPERLPAYDQSSARHIRIEPLSHAANYLSGPGAASVIFGESALALLDAERLPPRANLRTPGTALAGALVWGRDRNWS